MASNPVAIANIARTISMAFDLAEDGSCQEDAAARECKCGTDDGASCR
jgi:hypothetical protein